MSVCPHARTLRPILLVLSAATLLSACAAQKQRAPSLGTDGAAPLTSRDQAQLEAAQRELTRADARLQEQLHLDASGPDCASAGQLVGRVCALSERICRIAARHPAERAVQELCRDGRERCARGRQRLLRRCPGSL